MVRPTRPVEYLFDLRSDSWEIRNLADDPAYGADLERLRTETVEHSRRVGDVMFLPEPEMIARAAGSTPYERRRDPRYNPLDELLAAAELVGRHDATRRQLELLEHSDGAVRYWAAVGLYARFSRPKPPGKPESAPGPVSAAAPESAPAIPVESIRVALVRHLSDPAASVRVEAAAALLGLIGGMDRAARGTRPAADGRGVAEPAEALVAAIEGDDPRVAHQAVERVIYMPAHAGLFLGAVRRLHRRLSSGGAQVANAGPVFPLEQAADVYLYLYGGEPLIYPDDLAYENPAERIRDWDLAAVAEDMGGGPG